MNQREPIRHEARITLLDVEPVLRRGRRLRSDMMARALRRLASALRDHSHGYAEVGGLLTRAQMR